MDSHCCIINGCRFEQWSDISRFLHVCCTHNTVHVCVPDLYCITDECGKCYISNLIVTSRTPTNKNGDHINYKKHMYRQILFRETTRVFRSMTIKQLVSLDQSVTVLYNIMNKYTEDKTVKNDCFHSYDDYFETDGRNIWSSYESECILMACAVLKHHYLQHSDYPSFGPSNKKLIKDMTHAVGDAHLFKRNTSSPLSKVLAKELWKQQSGILIDEQTNSCCSSIGQNVNDIESVIGT